MVWTSMVLDESSAPKARKFFQQTRVSADAHASTPGSSHGLDAAEESADDGECGGECEVGW
jgi:hypothetical protein